jgi:hypothetical protein
MYEHDNIARTYTYDNQVSSEGLRDNLWSNHGGIASIIIKVFSKDLTMQTLQCCANEKNQVVAPIHS